MYVKIYMYVCIPIASGICTVIKFDFNNDKIIERTNLLVFEMINNLNIKIANETLMLIVI